MTGAAPLKRKPVILTMMGAWWPGNDASGPNQSLRASALALADRYDIRIVARDRPHGATDALAPPGWNDLGFARIAYLPPGRIALRGLRALVNAAPHDALWLNGFFDRELTLPLLAMRRAGLIARKPTLLSPRGEFNAGALGLKGGRKQLYLDASRRLGLLRDVRLHATSEAERDAFRATAPWLEAINIAANPTRLPAARLDLDNAPALRVAFVGRIARVKNLDVALRSLALVKAPVSFSIFGPVQEADHWAQCQQIIGALPGHIDVAAHGALPNEETLSRLREHDLFLLPTRGENFGHAIFEALASGVPVVISDTTPWRDLAADHAGWDLPLAEPERFSAAIDAFAALDQTERRRWRAGARARAERWTEQSGAVAALHAMFARLLSLPPT